VAVHANPAALFAALLCCGLATCDKSGGTKDWNTPGSTPPPPASRAAELTPAPAPAPPQAAPSVRDQRSAPTPETGTATTAGLRFITYNVENWLVMDRWEERDGKRVNLPGAPKPDKEKQAVITLLARHRPDVVGICEIGGRSDLEEIRTMLKARDLDLPHSHFASGSDPTRHLGLLSRFPITATGTPAKLDYQLNGTTFEMNRGILDATISARDRTYRFLGVHLKSQREVEEGDQAQMRLHEAHLLRAHVDAIIKAEPKARLIVYGDFNDNWGTPPLKTIVGTYNTPTYLTAIRAKDNAGVYWTHYWAIRDSYSRLDYVTVSQSMRQETNFPESRIIDDPEWQEASDHRPVMALFR
jgi:endonuclease/exonuclease/phosphatase family metal-dependent hydrolase